MAKRISENKPIRIIGNIIYWICTIFIIMLLTIVGMQRFSNNEIAIGGIRIFNVITQSMEPKYEVGDILVAKYEDPSQIEIGDDVVYLGQVNSYAGKIITHRVIDKTHEENGNYLFRTKGIANDLEDPVVYGQNIYGVIVYKIQSLSFISKMINDVYKFYFFIFVPIVVIIFLEIFKVVKSKDEENEEKEVEEIKNDSKKETIEEPEKEEKKSNDKVE